MTSDAVFLGADVFGTRAMLLQFALLAMRVFGLALTLFLSVLESRLIVVFHWSSSSLLLLVRIWFRKRKRKPPDSNKTNNFNIRPHPAHPSIFWKLPLLNNDCERGRATKNKNHNLTSAAIHDAAQGDNTIISQIQIAANLHSAAIFQLLYYPSLNQARQSFFQVL